MGKENVKSEEFKLSDYITIGERIKLEMCMLILTIWFMSPFVLIIYFVS